jgi:hypothetical protein
LNTPPTDDFGGKSDRIKTPIERTRLVVAAGLTTVRAIAIATGLSEEEVGRLIDTTDAASPEQIALFNTVVSEYEKGVKIANAQLLKRRLYAEELN